MRELSKIIHEQQEELHEQPKEEKIIAREAFAHFSRLIDSTRSLLE